MADKKDSTPSIVDFVASLVSKSDSRGVDSTYGSVVKDKTKSGSLSSEEESRVDKIATRFGKILKVGAFAEGPEARRNVGTTSGVKGTEAIKDKMQGITATSKSSETEGIGSFLAKVGIAAAVIGGLLLAFKDNETVQKVLAKFGDILGFLSEKFNQFINIEWDALDLIAIGIGGLVGTALILALSKLALTLPVAAIGIGLLAGSLFLLNKVLPDFEAISWDTIGKAGAALGGLGVIGVVLGKLGLGSMFKGALGLTLLSGALYALAQVLPAYEKLDWDTIGKAGAALGGLGIIGTVFGTMLGTITKGAIGLTLLGGALWVLGEKGIKPFTSLDWKTLGIGLAAVAGFGILGGIAGVFAPQLLLGALAIGAIGVALIPFAYAADLAAPAIEKIIGAFSDLYGNILEKMPPLVEKIGILITGVIDSVSGGVNSLISTLSTGVTNVLDSIKGIIKQSGDTIVNIANGVSDSISRFFERLADTILKLNGVDTDKLKQIGPALSSIGKGLLEFGGKGLIGEILTGLGSLFGADSPLEKFQKLGEVAPKIQSIPKALEELTKYKDIEFLNKVDMDSKITSIKDINDATWRLKGTLDKLKSSTVKKIEIDLSAVKISVLDKINSALLNLISSTNNLKNISFAGLTDTSELNLFGVFSDNKTVTSINEVNAALLNLLDTQEKLKANSKDLENIRGSFDIKTLNTVSDTNIKNLTADTTEYHSYAKIAMNDQIKRQDVMIDLLRQLVMKPTGGTSINTSTIMQQDINKTFDIRDQFAPYTTIPNNLLTQ